MTKIKDKKQAPKKKKEIGLKIQFSGESCTKEESIRQIANFCYTLLEMDRAQHKRQLESGTQHCDYCGKEITELYDFFSPDSRNACFECAKKVVDNPNRQKTFCGIPVVESKK